MPELGPHSDSQPTQFSEPFTPHASACLPPLTQEPIPWKAFAYASQVTPQRISLPPTPITETNAPLQFIRGRNSSPTPFRPAPQPTLGNNLPAHSSPVPESISLSLSQQTHGISSPPPFSPTPEIDSLPVSQLAPAEYYYPPSQPSPSPSQSTQESFPDASQLTFRENQGNYFPSTASYPAHSNRQAIQEGDLGIHQYFFPDGTFAELEHQDATFLLEPSPELGDQENSEAESEIPDPFLTDKTIPQTLENQDTPFSLESLPDSADQGAPEANQEIQDDLFTDGTTLETLENQDASTLLESLPESADPEIPEADLEIQAYIFTDETILETIPETPENQDATSLHEPPPEPLDANGEIPDAILQHEPTAGQLGQAQNLRRRLRRKTPAPDFYAEPESEADSHEDSPEPMSEAEVGSDSEQSQDEPMEDYANSSEAETDSGSDADFILDTASEAESTTYPPARPRKRTPPADDGYDSLDEYLQDLLRSDNALTVDPPPTKSPPVTCQEVDAAIDADDSLWQFVEEIGAAMPPPKKKQRGWGPPTSDSPPCTQVLEVVLDPVAATDLPPPPLTLLAEAGVNIISDKAPPLCPALADEWLPMQDSFIDIDAYAVTVYPRQLLKIFSPDSLAKLVSFEPAIKDLDHYNNWVYIAQFGAMFLVEPKFKASIIQKLQAPPQKSVIYAHPHGRSFAMGSPIVLLRNLVKAMEDSEVQNVRVQAYGMKAPLLNFGDPAGDEPHPLQDTNVYDVAYTNKTSKIVQVTEASKLSPYKCHPYALRVGKGYGGVDFEISSKGNKIYRFKAYPPLTHVLKATSMGAGKGSAPNMIITARKRISVLSDWKARLEKCPEEDMQGLRLEVSVIAPTSKAAVQMAKDSRLLDAQYLFSDEAGRHKLKSHTITKADLLQDATRLMKIEQQKQIIKGSSSKKCTRLQQRVVTDLYNSIGWNPGPQVGRPSGVGDPYKWWTTGIKILRIEEQLDQFDNLQKLRLLYSYVQTRVPCHNKQCPGTGQYASKGRVTHFRVECSLCKQALTGDLFKKHMAFLLGTAKLPGLDIKSLVADTRTMVFVQPPKELRLIALSQRPELQNLKRSNEFQKKEHSMLCCLLKMLHPNRHQDEAGMALLRNDAIGWLEQNHASVAVHIGQNSQEKVREVLDRLRKPTLQNMSDELLFLQGIAGVYKKNLAHLELRTRKHGCQIIPVGSSGPFLGLVLLPSKGYEICTRLQ